MLAFVVTFMKENIAVERNETRLKEIKGRKRQFFIRAEDMISSYYLPSNPSLFFLNCRGSV